MSFWTVEGFYNIIPVINKLNESCVQALASVLFISFAPVVLLIILPVDNNKLIRLLLALAAGCLLGDAFLHLIPESQEQHSHDSHQDSYHDNHHHKQHHHHHNHDHEDNHIDLHSEEHTHSHDNTIGLRVLGGIILFFVLEKYIYAWSHDAHAKKKKDDDHHNHIHASGILNLIADFCHNFTDGLAIGASFLSGPKLGLSTTLSIFLHEIPHEIGDYAILVQSGFSRKKAIWLQCVTAIGAISGTVLSLLLGNLDRRAQAWILPFTAGGFIYIAMVHLIPQLKNSSLKQTIVELTCFALGVGIMMLLD